jgi:hypothetical protein
MTTHSINPDTFFQHNDVIAIIVRANDKSAPSPDEIAVDHQSAGLLVDRHGQRTLIQPDSTVRLDQSSSLLIVRTSPVELVFRVDSIAALDGFHVTGDIRLRIAPLIEASELAALQNTLMGTANSIRRDRIHEYLAPAMDRALSIAAEGRGVEALMDSTNENAFHDELASDLKGACFKAGLKLSSIDHVTFDAPAYRAWRESRADAKRRREEFAARERIKSAMETAQLRHVQHLQNVLQEIGQIADQHRDRDLSEIVRTFPDQQRGEIYQALFGADDKRAETEHILVAAGRSLYVFDPQSLAKPSHVIELDGQVGPVRSVVSCRDDKGRKAAIVGASTGLYEIVQIDNPKIRTYAISPDQANPPTTTKGGFNAIAVVGERLFATHSELGLFCWKRNTDEPPEQWFPELTTSATAVRAVCFHKGRIYFSVNERVVSVPADAPHDPPTEFIGHHAFITEIHPTEQGIYAGNAEGEILRWNEDQPTHPEIVHAGHRRAVESITLVDCDRIRRLYYTDTSTAVYAGVLGDAFVCRYEAGGQTIRRAAVASDWIVATNDIRDRLICWRPGEPNQPAAVVEVSRLTGHSVQDVALVQI